MTKDFQQELTEVIKEGVKPSDLKRKLKRSKSADDVASSSTPNLPLKKSQSQVEIPLIQPTLEEQNFQLQEQVKFHAETAANYLTSLQTSQSKVSEGEEKAKQDQQKIDQLKESNEKLVAEINQLKDHILELRLENIQDFGKYREQLKAVENDLTEQIKDDQQEIKELEKRVNLLTKERTRLQRDKSLVELKLSNLELGESNHNSDWWIDYTPLLSLILVSWLSVWLLSKNIPQNNH